MYFASSKLEPQVKNADAHQFEIGERPSSAPTRPFHQAVHATHSIHFKTQPAPKTFLSSARSRAMRNGNEILLSATTQDQANVATIQMTNSIKVASGGSASC